MSTRHCCCHLPSWSACLRVRLPCLHDDDEMPSKTLTRPLLGHTNKTAQNQYLSRILFVGRFVLFATSLARKHDGDGCTRQLQSEDAHCYLAQSFQFACVPNTNQEPVGGVVLALVVRIRGKTPTMSSRPIAQHSDCDRLRWVRGWVLKEEQGGRGPSVYINQS